MAQSARKKQFVTALVMLLSICLLVAIVIFVYWLKWQYTKFSVTTAASVGQIKTYSGDSSSDSKLQDGFLLNSRLTKVQAKINHYEKAMITYRFGNNTEIVDQNLIEDWLIVDGKQVNIDTDKVKEYVSELAEKYNTVGSEREFVTSYGKRVTVSGGAYGWKIDQEKEAEELIQLIKDGQTAADHEPVYSQKAKVRGVNDIGDTYVEINMTAQRMWYYNQGELQVETDVVTGNLSRNMGTPSMVAYIQNKIRNINLVGDDYVAYVNYWMKLYGGIGIHDASWRSRFGGIIYKTNGSHGCINTPYSNMKALYDEIEVGTPVLLFYEDSD